MEFVACATFLCFILLVQISPSLSNDLINPPPGNSIVMTTLVKDGHQVYECKSTSNGKKVWVPVLQIASLRDTRNESVIVGHYLNDFTSNKSIVNAGTWKLLNNDGDQAESGQQFSFVSGKKISVNPNGGDMMSNFLAQARWHKYAGSAARISYVSQHNGLLLSPLPSKCDKVTSKQIVQFKAQYTFWAQDVEPPQVPSPLSLSSTQRPALSFFGQGVVKYDYDDKLKSWKQTKMIAHLYDIPGGIYVGSLSYNTTHALQKQDLMCISINDPNGLRVCGIQSVLPEKVTSSSLPWSLFQVTQSAGKVASILGPFTFFHFVSTTGGVAPPNSLNITGSTSHQVWKSQFSAILWIYTNKVVSKHH